MATFVLLFGTGTALATTGGQPLEELPIYGLTPRQVAPYLGKFEENQRHSQLIAASLDTKFVVSYLGRSVVEGTIVVRQYESAGRPATWIGTTYEYHDVGGTMHIDIWTPDGKKLLGRLYLRPGAAGALTGSMKVGGKSYPTSFTKVGVGDAPRSVAAQPAKQTEEGAAGDDIVSLMVERLMDLLGGW